MSSTPFDHGTPYGLRDGNLLNVGDVESGLACGCTCPDCGGRLVARKGAQVTHHFAHALETSCGGGWETALHLLAKQTILAARSIRLPPATMVHRGDTYDVSRAPLLDYDRAVAELRLTGETVIQPDAVIMRDGIPLLVEVTVTHRSTDIKLAELRRRGLNCIDIDLSKLDRFLPAAAHRDAILDSAPRAWLYNRRLDDQGERLAHQDRERRLAAERVAIARRRSSSAQVAPPALAEAIAAALATPGSSMDFGSDRDGLALHRRAGVSLQLSRTALPGPFRVRPVIWQSSALACLWRRPQEAVGVSTLCGHLVEMGHAEAAVARAWRQDHRAETGLSVEVEALLGEGAARGWLRRVGGGWTMAPGLRELLGTPAAT